MLCPALTRSLLRTSARLRPCSLKYSTATKKSDPLRILFCGSDEFSCASLRALQEEQKRNASLIRSIDVVVRPSKPTGRGYKVLREVPLRTLADQLKLPIHVRDTFTGWDMPQPGGDPINLIIAVSFGLFVPPRLLNASKYGGLNVHPSLLPDLRGPAPLHHALLAEHTHTGITIQTLSPHAFDEGTILLQTPQPGTPIPPACTVPQLHDLLAPAGAAMLVDALRLGLHVPPHPPNNRNNHSAAENPQLRHAPKIGSADRQISWATTSAHAIALRERVLGPLWTHLSQLRSSSPNPNSEGAGSQIAEKRVILEDLSVADPPPEVNSSSENQNWGFVDWVEKRSQNKDNKSKNKKEKAEDWTSDVVRLRYFTREGDTEAVVMGMPDGSWLRIGRIKVEGATSKPARRVLEGVGVK